MSAIGYITDSKMLELHRLNNHKTINFWRLSNKLNFSDFFVGDLVFFLSKDKEHKKGKEKGIVGFGRLKQIHLNSIKYLWDKYGALNGYNSLDEFKNAILKVSKEKKLPSKISSLYLEDVHFFQPIYLSECDITISNNVESYIYINPEEKVIDLLKLAHNNKDLWSNIKEEDDSYKKELSISLLFLIHSQIKEIKHSEKTLKKAKNNLSKITGYQFIRDSKSEIYCYKDNHLEIIFYHDNKIDDRLIIGQAYKYFINFQKEMPDLKIIFKVSDNNQNLNKYLSTIN